MLSKSAFSREEADGIAPWPTLAPLGIDETVALVLVLDGERHARVRRLAADQFSASAVRRHRPRIEEVVTGLVDELIAGGDAADLFGDMGLRMSLTLIGDILGIPEPDRPQFRAWSDSLLVSAELDGVGGAAMMEMFGYMTALVSERRDEPADDLISLMAARASEAGVPDEAVALLAVAITVGGWETTAASLTCGVLRLLTEPHPEGGTWWRALCDEPDLIPGAVEEILRTVPSSWNGSSQPRRATAPVQIGSVRVEAGQLAIPVHDAANRDPSVFQNAGVFDPARERNQHLAFALGPHVCLGAHLAALELQIALSELTRRLPGLRLAVDPADLEWDTTTMVRRPTRLPVAWGP
ncbi:cytochrome P450 [Spirillospora sp. CA-294931]|uniref:cytochrome P450 n=1 Tax=Spirillospora sp. CA-294931 TaxID=3240042 RepID=UPI003D8B13E6